jgi:hypothetical protein
VQADQSGSGVLGTLYQGIAQQVRSLLSGGQEYRSQRRAEDHYVTGGTHWDGYSLESLVKMVAVDANPVQLEMLADTWRRQGEKLSSSADNLRRSLVLLMQYWSGEGADEATRTVARNSTWVSELGRTSLEISRPVDDSGGALRSAQSTMPGVPKGGFWSSLGTAGGAAAAGFAIGGPFGAAAGAVIGGFASAFGFGNKKKKMKRKAVETMTRFETAVLGIDRATPQFSQPADGVMDPIWNRPAPAPGGGVGHMPGGGGGGWNGGGALPGLPGGGAPGGGGGGAGWGSTVPSFADGASSRWQSLTGVGPYGPGGAAGIGGIGSGGAGFGADDLVRRGGLMGGVPGMGGLPMTGRPGGGAGTERGASRYGRAGLGAGAGGYGPGGMGAGAGSRKEDDQEHRRRFPVEEDDLFGGDMRAAPPVIGL